MKANGNLTDEVAESLIELIIENHLHPGDRIPNEFALAEQLGVGRSTIREAVRRLVSRNILEVHRGSGTFVSEKRGIPEDPLGLTFLPDDKNVALELTNIRMMLEPEVAVMATQNINKEQLEKLELICSAVEKKIEAGEDYYVEDMEFHNYLAECSGNSVLYNVIQILVAGVRLLVRTTQDEHRENTYQEHRKVFQAIQKGDAIGARNAMMIHLNTSRESLINRIKELNAGQ